MNEKLTIRNFGPIKNLEIDLKPAVVLIGPQSTGKSTTAKLVSIFRDWGFIFEQKKFKDLLKTYNLSSFLRENTYIIYSCSRYHFRYELGKEKLEVKDDAGIEKMIDEFNKMEKEKEFPPLPLDEHQEKVNKEFQEIRIKIDELKKKQQENKSIAEDISLIEERFNKVVEESEFLNKKRSATIDIFNELLKFTSYSRYIPAERIFISMASGLSMNLAANQVPIPNYVLEFGAEFEKAREKIKELTIDFLKLKYKYVDGEDRIYINDTEEYINLKESASGFQTTVPLFLVIQNMFQEHVYGRTFVIEEPELNLFPAAIKKIIEYIFDYCAIRGKKDNTQNELVITTHSPYVLTAINNLLIAYKAVKEKPEIKEQVITVLDERYWLNPENIAAYYIDNGTAQSIINKKTGLIAENKLDEVSEEINNEYNQILELMYQTHL